MNPHFKVLESGFQFHGHAVRLGENRCAVENGSPQHGVSGLNQPDGNFFLPSRLAFAWLRATET